MSDPTLESQSLWYKYKTKVWLEKSEQTAVVHNIMRTLRAIHNSGNLAYASVPITSGWVFYNLMLERPLSSRGELIKAAIEHNYQEGWNFVQVLRERLNYPILFPADLIPAHQHWEQDHFQALWLSILAEKCTKLYMSRGWEYSKGGVEEFVHAWQLKLGIPKHRDLIFFNTKESEEAERKRMRNIKIYDRHNFPITIDDGIDAITKSLSWLKNVGLESESAKHQKSLELLHWTKDMIRQRFYQ